MAYTQNYSQNDRPFTYFKASTDALSMYSNDAMLRITYYDTTLQIELRKVVMSDDGKRKFPKPEKGKEINVVLTMDKVQALSDAIDRHFIPKFEALVERYNSTGESGTPSSVAMMGDRQGTKLISISTGEAGQKGYEPEITIYTDIGEDRIPGNKVTFKTSSVPVLVDYNEKTGDFGVINTVPQFYIFMIALHSFIETINKASLHFSKTRESASMLDVVERIAIALNVPVQTKSTYGGEVGGTGGKANNFANATINYENSSLEDMIY